MPQRINLGSQHVTTAYPDLLKQHISDFGEILQIGATPEEKQHHALYKMLQDNFPLADNKRDITINFVDYIVGAPPAIPQACLDKGITYGVPLTLKVQTIRNDDDGKHVNYEKIFLGTVPYMTPSGSFIYKGVERNIVSQIHRSYGVFFSQSHHASGAKLYSAKIIPLRGTWIEFVTDVNQVMYAYIDRRKKFPATLLLRAIGYGSDKEILDLFDLADEVKTTAKDLRAHHGRKLAARVLKTWTSEFVDQETGEVTSIDRSEVLLERDTILDEDSTQVILESNAKTILLHKGGAVLQSHKFIFNTLYKDTSNSTKEAIEQLYYQLRSTEPPDEQTAREDVHHTLFSNQRSFMGKIGRYCLNRKLKPARPTDNEVLTPEDLINIVKHIVDFINGKAPSDDIDHLSNRRVRTPKEQLCEVLSSGINRMARQALDKLNVRNHEEIKARDFVSPRALLSSINSFFSTNPLVQLADSVNPLTQIDHKRRISALGPGGLTRERAGLEARDVHYTHYGRICPIQTSEGQNIGLILSLAMHAKVDEIGFIRTPYRKVQDGKVDFEAPLAYLTAEDEENQYIAQATEKLDKEGKFVTPQLKVRQQADLLVADAKEVNYMDVAPNQMVSVSASLIPALEHDDAVRALMGSNMQRQAVPLLQPQAPIVGTGTEGRVVHDFRGLPKAESDGIVTYVDAEKIVVTYDDPSQLSYNYLQEPARTYYLTKFKGNSQGTCLNFQPMVYKGDRVTKGQLLCQGYATAEGELALGCNLRVAYMSWQGYNFEDGIVVSDRVVKEDLLTSVHIETFNVDLRSTKAGLEEFTDDIPNMSEGALKNLDKCGMVRTGKRVREGEILVGKVTPKVEVTASPEDILLRAIFGEKAYHVRNVSLTAPPSFDGIVIGTKILERVPRDKYTKARVKKEIEQLRKLTNEQLQRLRYDLVKKIFDLLQDQKMKTIHDASGNTVLSSRAKISLDSLLNLFEGPERSLQLTEACPLKSLATFAFTKDEATNTATHSLLKAYNLHYTQILAQYKGEQMALEIGDELPLGVLKQAKVYVAKKRKLKVGDKVALRHGAKGIVSKIVPQEDMPYFADGTPVDLILSPLGIPSRMNIGQLYEAQLGWAGQALGKKYAMPVFDSPSQARILEETTLAKLPDYGRATLYNGLTGEPFDQKVTCGVVYLLKLNHLVDDKMHARATGPYAMITQQPLGGKSQFGGQKVGEMELWTLEAYGASNILEEILTLKSDDLRGRKKAFEALVKGKPLPPSNTPESFKVVLQTLQGLGIELSLK